MASTNFMASTAVLVLLLITSAKGDFLSPFSSPFMDICNDVNCGKGNCTMDSGSLFGFSCECDNGWKRTPFDNETKNFEFLPCIIPNCSLNYSCMPAAPPAPAMAHMPKNPSIFDPCYSIYCGEGTCTNHSTYSYTCQCDSGSYNLNSSPLFPCYSNCSLGSDCQKLGIGVSTSTPSTPGSQVTAATPNKPPAPSLNNATALLLPGKFHWIAIICVLMISNAMVQWK